MELKEFVPLAPLTTLKVGGLARYFVDVRSPTALKEAVAFAQEKRLPVFVLGGGSNVLIADDGFAGVVLHIIIPGMTWEDAGSEVYVTVGAGVSWDSFVAEAVKRGYWGVENLSAIPGSVGASVIQNIGAYGAEVAQSVEWVETYSMKEGMVRKISVPECAFSYRSSLFKHDRGKELIVTAVCFRLRKTGTPNVAYKDLEHFFSQKKDPPTLAEVRAAVIAIRSAKLPDISVVGTAGSFFKHPIVPAAEAAEFLAKFPDAPHFSEADGRVKLSAGWIIDHVLQWKGMRKGAVGTWEKQALTLVNYGGATERDIRSFAREIQYRVALETNIHLEPEVVFVGGEKSSNVKKFDQTPKRP